MFFIYLIFVSRISETAYMDTGESYVHDGGHGYEMNTDSNDEAHKAASPYGWPVISVTGKDIRLKHSFRFFFDMDAIAWLSMAAAHLKGTAFPEIARYSIIIFVSIMAITVLFGRVFCGFICPFGTLHHMAGFVFGKFKGMKEIERNRAIPYNRIKYALLIAFMISLFFGLNAFGWMDPISFAYRGLALTVLPGIHYLLSSAVSLMADSNVPALSDFAFKLEDFAAPVFGYNPRYFQGAWLIGAFFFLFLYFNSHMPRFWCRVLCPLGALLGLLSKFALLSVHVDKRCISCRNCVKTCEGAALTVKDTPRDKKTREIAVWNNAECVKCFNCLKSCPDNRIFLKFDFPERILGRKGTDMGRRVLMKGFFAGAALSVLARLDGRIDVAENADLIRPPGALPEKEFLESCIRCGLCMKVCPTNAVHPAITEAGLSGFWTPRLIMTLGYCEYTCTLCSSVCPTGAIMEMSALYKMTTPVRIGSSFLDRGRCLPWSGNGPCIVCEEHCPTSPKAIYFRKETVMLRNNEIKELQYPYVDLSRCVGCGICENKCPVRGLPAIQVISAGETRSTTNRILL